MKVLHELSNEDLRNIEIMCDYAIKHGITVEESKEMLQHVLLTQRLRRWRTGGYIGKVDFLGMARLRNKELKEKLNER